MSANVPLDDEKSDSSMLSLDRKGFFFVIAHKKKRKICFLGRALSTICVSLLQKQMLSFR